MLRAIPQREEEFAAGQSRLSVAAHTDAARMRRQGLDLRMQLEFIGNEITAGLLAEGRIADVDPVPRHDAFDGVMIHIAAQGRVQEAVHRIRRGLRQKLHHDPGAICHMEGHLRISPHPITSRSFA